MKIILRFLGVLFIAINSMSVFAVDEPTWVGPKNIKSITVQPNGNINGVGFI